MASNAFVILIQQLAFSAPLYLAMLIAIAMSLANWRKARTAAMLTLMGATLIIAESLLASVIRVVLIQNFSAGNFTQWHMVLSAFSSMSFAAGLLLILVAVFVDRPPRNR